MDFLLIFFPQKVPEKLRELAHTRTHSARGRCKGTRWCNHEVRLAQTTALRSAQRAVPPVTFWLGTYPTSSRIAAVLSRIFQMICNGWNGKQKKMIVKLLYTGFDQTAGSRSHPFSPGKTCPAVCARHPTRIIGKYRGKIGEMLPLRTWSAGSRKKALIRHRDSHLGMGLVCQWFAYWHGQLWNGPQMRTASLGDWDLCLNLQVVEMGSSINGGFRDLKIISFSSGK